MEQFVVRQKRIIINGEENIESNEIEVLFKEYDESRETERVGNIEYRK